MTHRRLAAASAALFCLTLAGAQPLPAPPPGAGNGYVLRTQDGRCAMWVSSDTAPQPGERTSWSGACKDGWGDGFGIQEFVHADKSRERYVGHVRQGRWNGIGRVQGFDAQGQFIGLDEGVYLNDGLQGPMKSLLADHPLNAENLARIRKEKSGREVGGTYLLIHQFFLDGQVKLLCSRNDDCVKEAETEGHALPATDLGEGMNQALSYGGWTFELKSDEKSDRTRNQLMVNKPMSMGMCLEAAAVRKGSEPRIGAFLFPSFSAWQAYLRADQQCEDVSATLEDGKLTWKSQCQPADKSELVSITQLRTVSDKGMQSRMEVVVTQRGKVTARSTKDVTGKFVGACTDDMVRAGEMKF